MLGRARETIAHLKAHRLAREAKVLAVMKAPTARMDDWVARAYDDVPSACGRWPGAPAGACERIRAMAPGNRLSLKRRLTVAVIAKR